MRISRIAACALFVLVAALPFEPWSARRGSSEFEARINSGKSGLVRIFFDVGRGYGDADSGVAPVIAGQDSTVRIPLPSGQLNGLRLAFLNRDVEFKVSGAHIAMGNGGELKSFSPADVQGYSQIDRLEVQGGTVVVGSSRDASYPQISFALTAPIALPHTHWMWALLGFFAALCLGVECAASFLRPDRLRGLWLSALAKPGRTIALAAVAGTVLANYPVIFAGKSVVSPNLNSALLYGENPYLPGFQSVEAGNSNSADIDALMWQHVPFSMMQDRALLSDRELPLWNRYNASGVALLGQGQSCLGDPLQLLPILAGGASWAWDLKFLLCKALLGIGVGYCVWRLTRHLGSSMLMAISAQFIGFFVYRVNHPAIFSLCYSPWILYAWLRILDARTLSGSVLWMGALLVANTTELCSGTVKEAYILLLSVNFSGLCMLLLCEKRWDAKLKLLAGVAVEGVAFAMLTAPAWFTFLRELKSSRTTYDAPQTYQVQPGMVAGLFDEIFYRPFQIFINVVNPSANFFILLGLAWVFATWKYSRSDKRVVALLVSALPALLLVYGVIPPGLVAQVPFLGNILHVDNTFSCVLILLFTVLAGFGWKQAFGILGTGEGRSAAMRVGIAVLVVYLAYLGTVQTVVRSQYYQQTWGALVKQGSFVLWYGVSLVAGSFLLLWVLRRARSRGSWTGGSVILAVLSFATLHWRHGLQAGMATPDYVIMPTSRVDFLAPSLSVEAVKARLSEPSRAVGFMDNLFPGWTGAYGIEGICGPDALMNKYYRDLMGISGIERMWDWRYRLQDKDLVHVKPLLDLLNVRFYMDYPAGHRDGREILTPVFSGDMEVYESRSTWPRAFFTDRVAVYGELPQLWTWISAERAPFAAIQHEDWMALSPAPVMSGELAGRTVKPATDYALTGNSTSFKVSASGPGLIILSEAYERANFVATLNGVEVPYFRVNQAFKGLYVDRAGTYLVKFSYWPADLTLTLVLSAIGGVVGLAAWIVALSKAKSEGPMGPLEA